MFRAFPAGQPSYGGIQAVLLDTCRHYREWSGRKPHGKQHHGVINVVKPVGRFLERCPITIGKIQVDILVIACFFKSKVSQAIFQEFGEFKQAVLHNHTSKCHTNWMYSGSTSTEAANKVGNSTNSLLVFEPRVVTNVPI